MIWPGVSHTTITPYAISTTATQCASPPGEPNTYADPESPWAEYAGTGLTAMRLGALLREYDIRSDTIRFPPPTGQAKGYHRTAFTDAWHRYCPPPDTPDPTEEPYQPYHPSSETARPDNVVQLKPHHTTRDEMPPPPGGGATGVA